MLARMLLVCLAGMPVAAAADTWRLDPSTTIEAEVEWQGKSVPVRFPGASGDIDFDAAHPDRTKGTITVPAGQATTGVAVVDSLVRSQAYLDADSHPTITFELDKLLQTSKSTAEIDGKISLRGVTKPLAFAATVFAYGPAKDDPERFEAGFNLTGEIDRSEFGSTGGVPGVSTRLPIKIRLLMTSE